MSFPHSASNLIITITTNLNERSDNESWGFREFQLGVTKCPEGCLTCTKGQVAAQCNIWKSFSSSWTQADGLTLDNWIPSTNEVPKQTNCAGVNIFGGYSQLGKGDSLSKVFFNLPPHSRILIKVSIWGIDSWDNERFSVMVDGTEVAGRNFQHQSGVIRNLCGNPTYPQWLEGFESAQVEVAHSQFTVTVEFRTGLDQADADESWGIRDFYLFTDVVSEENDPNKPVYQAFMNPKIDPSELSNWQFKGAKQTNYITSCGD